MAPDELLARLSSTLRHDIGPAVVEPFPKTQAFMASVVLEKLSAQIRLASAHAEAEATDLVALAADLPPLLGTAPVPAAVAAATDRLAAGDGVPALSALVAALWAEREALGPERFEAVLARARITMRARIDRQMEYAA
ncbi:MAG: hypothetical protein OEY70_12285 [Acidimicrobiia bacterium]|nr:hypothetical protein [Acidimicrobiia bacterium]